MSFSTNFEFAKLRALFAHVRYVLTCFFTFVFYMLYAYVPLCYVPTGSEILMKKSTYFSMSNFDNIFLKYKITLNWMTFCKYNGSTKIMIITSPNFASVKICSHNLICMSLKFKVTFTLVHLCIKS